MSLIISIAIIGALSKSALIRNLQRVTPPILIYLLPLNLMLQIALSVHLLLGNFPVKKIQVPATDRSSLRMCLTRASLKSKYHFLNLYKSTHADKVRDVAFQRRASDIIGEILQNGTSADLAIVHRG
ncbi:hypothetical protein HHI36_005731 [Cryptolaemus montrouzieri]|uniref:Uncharacterized protein n=1 Tax=Cryptolaemus montrouzieri TaxID=559131 RepID=A0ABD2NVZ9_9CUCU